MSGEALPLRIGRYELLFEIGSGGMGKVFLARQLGDSGFERLVAVKRVHPHLVSDPDVYAMVSDEARIAALLRHPNVVPVVDVLDKDGELLLILEYVEGFALSALLRAGKGARGGSALPPALASRIAIDALRGLHAAHSARDLFGEPLELVHRDVSPQNLLVGSDGMTRIIDFGIARAKGNVQLTATGVVKGKVAYMAPERVENRDVDRRADVFAMGAVLAEMLTGKAPFASGDESANLARAMLGEMDLDPVRAASPKLLPVIERALSRTPSERYATAEEMARAISVAEPPEPPEEVAEWVDKLKRADLDARRERTSEALARSVELEAADPKAPARGTGDEADGPASLPFERAASKNTERAAAARDSTEATTAGALVSPVPSWTRASWIFGVAAVLAVNVVAWFGLVRTQAETLLPSVRRASDVTWRAPIPPAAQPAAPGEPVDAKAAGARAETEPASIATSMASSAAPPAASAGRAPVSLHPVELHSNPYHPH